MVYDKLHQIVILYGGSRGANWPVDDMWIWDGSSWTECEYSGDSPGARFNHTLVYNDDEQRVYLSGGYDGSNYLLGKYYWDHDNNCWVEADNTTGTALADGAAAYDSGSDVIARYGGDYSSTNDVPPGDIVLDLHTESSDSDDTETTISTHTTSGNNTLEARRSHAMAFFAAQDLMIVFGGVDGSGNYYNDTTHLRGSLKAAQNPASSPTARAEHAMVYDSIREELVMWGGIESDGSLAVSRTWLYRVDNATPTITHTPVTNGIEGVSVDIEATITDEEEDDLTVTLYYRVSGAASYSSVSMSANGSVYSATIPSGSVTMDGVDYYIEADDTYSYPAYSGTESSPHEITITPSTGSLTVTLSPQDAIDAGAQWSVDGSNWYNSGQTLTLSIGSYSVQYSSLTGWDTPANSPVEVTSGGNTYATGTYVRQTGSLTVTILPQGAIDAGAQWRRTCTSIWYASGATETDIPTGEYSVEFMPIAGWITPALTVVTITDGGNATASGTYVDTLYDNTWVEISYAVGPCPRAEHAMAFDEARGEVVLFGGRGPTREGADVYRSTWTWNGTEWTKHEFVEEPGEEGTIFPAARWGHAMVYDKLHQVVILYGGSRGANWPVDDMWLWDGSSWTECEYSGDSPGARFNHTLVYNDDEQRVYLSGGYDGSNYLLGKYYWDHDNNCWVEADNTTGTALADGAAAYDSGSDVIARYGGDYSSTNDVPPGDIVLDLHTESSDSDDTETTISTHSTSGNNTLEARRSHAMAFFAAQDLMIVFGGVDGSGNYYNDTTHLRGSLKAAQNPASSPTARAEHAMVYDSIREELVMFGGIESDGSLAIARVWLYRVDNATPTITHTPVTNGIEGVPVDIEATITDEEEDDLTVTLYYRVSGAASYSSVSMSANGSVYSATIPSGSVTMDGVDYYIEADDSYSYPAYSGTESIPHVITVSPAPGYLTVTILPQGAIDAGAQWSVDGSNWYGSGQTLTLPIGSYSVQYSSLTGWDTPANSPVQITSGGNTYATGTYVRQTGSLTATILPQGAIDAGAQWRRTGTSTWYASGATETDIPTGEYSVEFMPIAGWITPALSAVTITDGGNATASGTYTRQIGTLNVNINAAGSGGSFSIYGPGDFTPISGQTSNYSASVPTGSYTVTFTDEVNYSVEVTATASPGTAFGASNPSTGTVSSGDVHTITGTYTLVAGSLTVTISPSEAVSDGAAWRRSGTSTWYSSGATETDIAPGSYTVEFQETSGWCWGAPEEVPVTITVGQTTSASGTYFAAGNIYVYTDNDPWVAAGAQWRIYGYGLWHNFGSMISRRPVGEIVLEFKAVEDWNEAYTVTNTITQCQTTEYREPGPPDGDVTVIITPVGARTDGARWRIINYSAVWLESGETELNVPVGDYSVRFLPIGGWVTPANIDFSVIPYGVTLSAYYDPAEGWVRIYIVPVGARNAGAQWNLRNPRYPEGEDEYIDSGVSTENLPNGLQIGPRRDVAFKTVSGWTKPAPFEVTIVDDDTVEATGTYTENAPPASEEDSDECEPILLYHYTPYTKDSLSSSIIMDFDGDGVTDISFYRPSDGTWHIYGRKSVVKFGGPDYWPVPGDYDGDGVTDFAYFDPETATWHIKGMPNVTFGEKGDEPVPGDYDGDGTTDIAVYRASEERVIIRDSIEKTSLSKSLKKGHAFSGDFDGDGKDDLASYDYTNGRWRQDGNSKFSTSGEEDVPALADYDGDGVTDYAVFRSVEGLWLFKGGKNIQFGQEGDIPCPGDYNGDGKAEIAVFRPSEGKWYVYGLFELEFGQAGDIPLVSGK